MTNVEDIMWVDKYRPKELSEVVGHSINIQRLAAMVAKKNVPHLLFSGPAGTGKTATAHCIGRALYGEHFDQNFIEFNASDERGIDVVRDKIKNYAKSHTLGDNSFIIIFLDEADALTDPAQAALRRIIENNSATCRFIFSCNYNNKLIEPIQSRCHEMRFGLLPEADMVKLIARIIDAENIKMNMSAIKLLMKYKRGDTRKIISEIQIASLLTDTITTETIQQSAMIPDDKVILQMMNLSLNGKYDDAREMMMNEFINKGFDSQTIIESMYYNVENLGDKMNGFSRAKLIDKLAQCDVNMRSGASPFIHLNSVLNSIGLLATIQTHCPNAVSTQEALIG